MQSPTTNTDEWQNGEYLIYQNTGGNLYLYESGSATWDSVTDNGGQYNTALTSSDVIGLEMTSSGQVKLYKNGVNVYTSTNTASGDYNIYAGHKGIPVTLTAYTTGLISQDYTTNIDGMIDEFFINSDVLTASEISDIDRRGETESSYTTSSTTFNDGTVVAGNEYFYKVSHFYKV